MGMSPAEVLDLPLCDYQASVHHYAKAQGGEEESGLSGDEFDEMLVGLEGQALN